MIEKLKKNIFHSILFAFILFFALSFFSDFTSVKDSLEKLSWQTIMLLPVIMLMNFFLRFLKWHYYVRFLNIKISFKESIFVFFSGLVMSVTPGKWGELLKSYFVKEISNEPVSRTAPIIFAERITDIISLIILALTGAFFYKYKTVDLIVLTFIFLLLLLIIGNRKSGKAIITFFQKFGMVRKYITTIENLYFGSRDLLKTVPLIKMIFLSFFAWFIEFFGFYIILRNFNIDISILWSSFIYSLSIIIGSFSMMPGGLGLTEVSLTYLLTQKGFNSGDAVAITIIVRIFTLWFSVFIGFISLIAFKKIIKISIPKKID